MDRHRRRLGPVLGALALALLVGACTPALKASAHSCAAGPPDTVTARIVELTNADRARSGAAPVVWDGQLYCLALDWSEHMARTGVFAHSDLATTIRTSPYDSYQTLGENILHGGASLTGDQVEAAWMSSPTHRANIVAATYTSFAVALARADDGSIYLTANFGR